uniref:Uncharacterized protein n=1 Tax=Candidatus Kentrum sp. TC TaxID=2126339 RepID=A0A450ZWE8_9GAMM|nr:MAG: hypothetical protein BECKTC1821F_GA0114240_10228 [Candidatus Kentron sp. TC]
MRKRGGSLAKRKNTDFFRKIHIPALPIQIIRNNSRYKINFKKHNKLNSYVKLISNLSKIAIT